MGDVGLLYAWWLAVSLLWSETWAEGGGDDGRDATAAGAPSRREITRSV
jgi:hypothetical protein